MNQKLTLAMLLVAVVLAGAVIYLSQRPASPPHHPNRLVFAPAPGPISELSFQVGHGRRLTLVRHGTHWFMTSPRHAWARDYKVQDLLSTLRKLSWPYHVALARRGPDSLQGAGLAPPRAVLTMRDKAGKIYRLEIGRFNAQGRLLVRPSGREHGYIDTVDSAWFKRLERSPNTFRSRSLTRFHTHTVAAIEIQTPAGRLKIMRHHHGWLLTKPYLAPANKGRVNNWLSNVQLLTAHRFSSLPQSSAGLQNGPLTITIDFRALQPAVKPAVKAAHPAQAKPSASPPLVVRFGRYTDLTDKFLYAYSSANPALAVVSKSTFTGVDKSFAALRDARLTRAEVRHATEVVLRRRTGVSAETPARLYLVFHPAQAAKPAVKKAVRKASVTVATRPAAKTVSQSATKAQWLIGTALTRPTGGPAHATFNGSAPLPAMSSRVRKLLKRIGKLRAKKFLSPSVNLKTLALAPAQRSLTVHIPGQIHNLKIAFGKPLKNGLTPVKMPQWPAIYLVSTQAVNQVFPTLSALRPSPPASPSRPLRRPVVRQAPAATRPKPVK